jgi:transposase InsO family protein
MPWRTRKVVGWAMRDHLRKELAIAALIMAIQRQRPARGLLHHSDRGSQYAAADYHASLKASGIVPSMDRKGDCRTMRRWKAGSTRSNRVGSPRRLCDPRGSHARPVRHIERY